MCTCAGAPERCCTVGAAVERITCASVVVVA